LTLTFIVASRLLRPACRTGGKQRRPYNATLLDHYVDLPNLSRTWCAMSATRAALATPMSNDRLSAATCDSFGQLAL
jgi:hypothetical protein